MALTKFHINKNVAIAGALTRTVEADSYNLVDGYFHFFTREGASANKTVYSIKATRVETVEVITA